MTELMAFDAAKKELEERPWTPSRDLALSLVSAAQEALSRTNNISEAKEINDKLHAIGVLFKKSGAENAHRNIILGQQLLTIADIMLKYDALDSDAGRPEEKNSSTQVDELTEKQKAQKILRVSREILRRWRLVKEARESVEEWIQSHIDKTLTVQTYINHLMHYSENGFEHDWLKVYNIWSFLSPDPRFGRDTYPGRIPGQINQNLNYYFSEPGDLVVDLFAGGGTTIDVCKADDDKYGNREILAYDRVPLPEREDIIKWDVVKDGVPDFGRAKLVFLDPPYWKQKAGEYVVGSTDMSQLGLQEFNDKLEGIISHCLNHADYVACIVGATQRKEVFVDHAAELIMRLGLPYWRVIVPYMTQQYMPFNVTNAKNGRYPLNLYRDLMIWRSNV
ncbi:hypothetical protein LCGC14_0660270 [marine sediment metagenome]|uniref:DNA methylase N-4/N-6 domain-containing protein n=1 Tax=marine sediment metagenome TaxID=412755 RepID=A0A0F9QYS4_9ZZZZ